MSKFVAVRKRLIREGLSLLGIVAVAGSLAFGLDSFITSKEEECQKLRGNVQTLSSQLSDVEKKINVVQSSFERYKALKKTLDTKGYDLDREEAKKTIDQMRKDFRVTNLKLEVSAEQVFDDASLAKYPSTEAFYRKGNVKFGAMTDLHAYAFIQAFYERLPGFVKPTQVHIARNKLIDNDALIAASKGDQPELVQVEVDFLWIGLRLKSTANPTGAVNAAP